MEAAGLEASPAGVEELYRDLADGIVADEEIAGSEVPVRNAPMRMDGAEGREALAAAVLGFAAELREAR